MSRIANRLIWIVLVGLMAILPLTASAEHQLKGRIVFIIDPDVYTMKPDGSDLRQLTNFAPQGARARQPTWSRDGQKIAFHFFSSQDAAPRLWIMNADGSDLHKVFEDQDHGDYSADFSPDDTQIVFMRCNESCAIFRVNVDGTNVTPITHSNFKAVDGLPVYSPDGKTIAFISLDRGGVLGAVYLMNPDGTNIRRLTPPFIGGQFPAWTPDGKRLYFTSHCCNPENDEIWSIGADGTDMQQITDTVDLNDFSPWSSPDGAAIVFERDGPFFNTWAIFVKRLDGTAQSIFVGPRPAEIPLSNQRSWRGRPEGRARVIKDNGFSPKWGPAAD